MNLVKFLTGKLNRRPVVNVYEFVYVLQMEIAGRTYEVGPLTKAIAAKTEAQAKKELAFSSMPKSIKFVIQDKVTYDYQHIKDLN